MTARLPAILLESPLFRPLRFAKEYDSGNLRPDLIAGVTVAVILLPQAIAFALLAELPPQMGLYAAIVAAVAGGLWGSSRQIHTGPTNALSVLVFSALAAAAAPGGPEYLVAAGLLAVMAGIFQLGLGMFGLGALVNFVSHSVVVGFASGAGVLIVIKQAQHLLGLPIPNQGVAGTLKALFTEILQTHPATAALGAATIAAMLLVKKFRPAYPAALIGMGTASVAVYALDLRAMGVAVLGRFPEGLPPFADLPVFDLDMLSKLSVGALAVGAIGLVETSAISRSIAAETGQRLDTNQEFVGQGLANVMAGFFSGYPCAGSFSRSAVNYKAGARSQMSSLFSAVFLLVGVFFLSPLAEYLPVSALAGVLIVTAFGMINYAEIARIYRGARQDAVILTITFLGTVLLNIEFAVLAGILLSFAFYIMKTSVPRVDPVLPDNNYRHFVPQGDRPSCPQLGVIEIRGDLYFGAVGHIEKAIHEHQARHPGQNYLLLRMKGVNHCDFSGIHALESISKSYRDQGGGIFVTRVQRPLLRVMIRTGFHRHLGRDHFLPSDKSMDYLFHKVIDPAVCIYECPVRAFRECQNLPKRELPPELAPHTGPADEAVPEISPRELWTRLHSEKKPLVIDVREPREFQSGHIAEAKLMPLPQFLATQPDLPTDRTLVLVCRGGRRSKRAAASLQSRGYSDVYALGGGMLAWEDNLLLEAIDGHGVLDETTKLH